jgi:hypothetical protein
MEDETMDGYQVERFRGGFSMGPPPPADTTADDYEAFRRKLAELTPEEVAKLGASPSFREYDPALAVALAEELARRGLKVPAKTTVEPNG